jgi:hypothetical protein
MTSGLYRFIAESDDSEGGVQRVFEYKDKDRPYLVRFSDRVDPKTNIVITSLPKGDTRFVHHVVSQHANNYTGIKSCTSKSGPST